MKRLIKIPLAGFSLVMFLIALVLYLYFFTSVPEQQLNDWLAHYIPEKTGYRITVEKAYRDIWKRIRLEGINVYKIIGDELIPVGHINSIEAHYSLRDIIFQDYHFNDLILDGANLSFVSESLTPADTAVHEKKPFKEIKFPNMAIDNITLRDINIRTRYGADTIDIQAPVLLGSFGNDGEIVDIKIDSLMGNCPQIDFGLQNLSAKVFRADREWMIESMDIQTDRSDITISGRFGRIADPDFHLSFEVAPFDLGDINSFANSDLIGLFGVRGNIQGNFNSFGGEIAGDADLFNRQLEQFTAGYRFESKILYFDRYDGEIFGSPFDGYGFLNFGSSPARYGLNGDVKDLNLQRISPDIYSSFTGKVDLTGEGLSENSFHMEIDMDLSNADIDIYHFDSASGKIDFDLNKLNFHEGFSARYKHTVSTFDGYLEYEGNVDIKGKTRFDDLADFENQIFITDLDGVGEAEFHVTGPTLDFTIDGGFQSDSCRFYGLYADSLDFRLNLKSFISHKVGRVVGGWRGGNLYSVPVDSGFFSVLVSGEKYFLEDIHVQNEHNRASILGKFDNGTIPPSLVIDTATIILWKDTVYTKTPLVIDVYEKEMEFQDFKLYSHSGNLEMAGIITYDQQMGLEIKTHKVEIQPIAAYFIKDRTFTGILSGEIYAGGDFESPDFEADLWFSGLTIDDVELGQLNVRANYSDLKLNLKPAELESETSLYTLTGTLPINLSFISTEPILPEQPIDLRLVASGKSIDIASVFIESVREFQTDFEFDIGITGTYGKPQVSGAFSARNGTLYVMELVEPLRDIDIRGRMVNDNIYIDTLIAYARLKEDSFTKTIRQYLRSSSLDEESRGKITGLGSIKVLGLGLFDYDIKLSGYGCEFYVDGYDVHFLTDFFLKVQDSSPPLVSGWAKLQRFELRDRFSKFITEEGQQAAVLEDSTQWNIKLEVSAANNLWIKNAESIIETEGAADMEMKGDLTITREKGIYNILGELDVIRGYFYLANLKFRLLSGSMIFDQPDTLDPMVNFDVTTKILTPSPQPNYTDLDLAITGRLSNLQIGTTAGSAVSDQDILMTLAENMVATGETNISENLAILGERLAQSLGTVSPVDMIDISREQFSDTTGGTQKVGTRFTVAKYISPKLFLTYSQRLSQENAGRTLGFEYILNNNLSIEGRQGTRNEGVSFDVNLHFEF